MKRRTILSALCLAALLTALLLRGLATDAGVALETRLPSPGADPEVVHDPYILGRVGAAPKTSNRWKRRALLDEEDETIPTAVANGDAGTCSITFQLVPPVATRFDPKHLVGRSLDLLFLVPGRDFQSIPVKVVEGLLVETPELPSDRNYVLSECPATDVWIEDAGPASVAVRKFRGEALHPFVLASCTVRDLAPGEHRRVQVPLLEGLEIHGRVVDEDGQPVARANIGLCREDAATGSMLVSYSPAGGTDHEGRFSVIGVAPTNGGLRVTKNGFLDEEVRVSRLGGGPVVRDLEITLQRGLTITGLVRLPDGRVVANAEVSCALVIPRRTEGYDLERISSARTNEEGGFVISGLQELEDLSTFVRLVARANLSEEHLLAKGATARAFTSSFDAATSWAAKAHPAVGGEGVVLVLQPPRPPPLANPMHPVEAARLRRAGLLDE